MLWELKVIFPISRNIDMKISLAELEYRIEKDQIDIINLS